MKMAPHMKILGDFPLPAQIVAGVVIAGSLVVLLAVYKVITVRAAIAQHEGFTPPPEAVTSIAAAETTWRSTLSAVGSVASVQGVTLGVEESGIVKAVHVESGVAVERGQLLVELDSSVEEAQLRGSLARLDRARQELERTKSLREKNAISKSEFDKAEAEYRSADSEASALKAQIARKRVIAPFAGKVGIKEVNVGQYLAEGSPVIPLYALDPLYVNFSLPQQSVQELATGQKVKVILEGDTAHETEGTLTAINPQVDERTRNVSLQAALRNEKEVLRPGMFVQVVVELPRTLQVVTIPNSSISYAPYGDSVFVIETMKDPKGKEYLGVRSQIVKLGSQRGEQVAILSGIKPGEQVVTSGVFKLRPGATVKLNNEFSPSNDPSPTPADS
jgi:membrane fusion protein (multidrug efflux system)